MKHWIIAIAICLGGLFFVLAFAGKGECRGYCFTGTCFSSAGCGGAECLCVKKGMDMTGYCVSVDRR